MRLVDADAIVKAIESVHCKDCNNYNGAMCRACTWMDAMDYIEDAPTVDAQPVKHGKWVKYPSIYRCSNCGNPKEMPKPYCELCGARMEGEEDEQA